MVEYLDGGRLQGITASLDNLKAYYNFNESSGNLINQQTTGDGLGSNANGTASGDPTYSQTGKVGNAISFDGVGDEYTLGTTAGQWNFLHNNSDFSIAFWMKLNATPNETQGILGTGTGGSSIGYEIAFNPSTGVMYNNIENGSGATSNINSSSGFVPSNTTTWYHYVITFSSGVWNIYRNGSNNETATDVISWSSSNHSRNMELGNANANTASDRNDLTGLLDELSIWNRVLTSAEISKLYDIGVAGIALKDSSSDFLGSPPSNVPDNTRFEDTGTRKIYRYNSAVTLQEGGWSGTLDDAIILYSYQGGGKSGVYVQINSGSALVGMKVSRVALQIIRHSTTNSYPACVGVWDSSNLPDHTASDKGAKHVFAEFNINQLSQGYVDEPSFGVDGDHDTGCDGEYTLQAGDYLGVSAHQGSGATVICQVKASYDGDKFDGANTQIALHQGAQSSFTNMADGGEDDMYIKIYGKAGWVERGVAV